MTVTRTDIAGVFLLNTQAHRDPRGLFTRVYCRREFEEKGLDFPVAQTSISLNPVRGTLRGLHYQTNPHAEKKLVSCVRGALFDVIVDLRPDSPTYRRWISAILSLPGSEPSSHVSHPAPRAFAVFIPEYCAHGFQTLEDDTMVLYQMSEYYHPECARGIRWDDPSLGIPWPEEAAIISPRDRSFETLDAAP